MNNLTVGDKLGLSGQVKELKLGKSFDTSMNPNTPGFHSFRYDFKPASVDASQVAEVSVEQKHQVSVKVPHHDSTSSTTFRGSQRPYQKECVLIIDHKTGELTLERLSCNVQLKKTRAEGSSKAFLGPQGAPPHGRPSTPNASQQPSMPTDFDHQPNPQRMKRPSPNATRERGHAASPVNKQRVNTSHPPTHRQAPAAKNVAPRPPAQSMAANSMPMLLDDSGRFDDTGLNLLPQATATQPPVPPANNYTPKPTQPPMPQMAQDTNTDIVEMSEGSSSASSSSGSSSGDSDSDNEDSAAPKAPAPAPSAALSMPTLMVNSGPPNSMPTLMPPIMESMLLQQDLHLSDSDDSDPDD